MKPFRGLTKDGKMVYGWYVKTHNSDGNNTHWIIKDGLYVTDILIGINPKFPKQLQGCYEVIPESVAQQVGLKDKNKNEIYAGDRLQSGKRIFTVVWNEEDMQWKALEEDSRYCSLPLSVWAVSEQFEIIPPEVKEKSK